MLGTGLKNYERLNDPQNVYFQGAVEASIPLLQQRGVVWAERGWD